MRRGLVVTSVLTAALVGCGGLVGCAAPEPTRSAPVREVTSSSPSSPSDAPPPAVTDRTACPDGTDRPFRFSRAGYQVEGLVRGSGATVALLLHEVRGDPCDLAGLAKRLAAEGMRVVSWTSEPGPDPRALALLVARERARGAARVVLVGASAGGATSLVAAGRVRPPVDAVVALSPSSQDRRQGDVAQAVARYRGPLMAVASEYDPSFVGVPDEMARVHTGPETTDVYEGISDHGRQLVTRPDSTAADAVVEFLQENLR